MSEAHHRPKAPAAVRAGLIAAAADLLSCGGPLSIASVAEGAGVSKGAVQHHFGTREELLAAMCETFLQQFEQDLAAESSGDGGEGAAARAYVRATVRKGTRKQVQAQWRALLVASVIDRALAVDWSRWVADHRAKDPLPGTNELIMRLAADGLWLSDLLGVYKLSSKDRAALQDALLELSPEEKSA